jgi:hypothetical protein
MKFATLTSNRAFFNKTTKPEPRTRCNFLLRQIGWRAEKTDVLAKGHKHKTDSDCEYDQRTADQHEALALPLTDGAG